MARHQPGLFANDLKDDPTTRPMNPVVRDYEARRCHVCGDKRPAFGFEAPLAPRGETLWACGAHHRELQARLVAAARP